ncbi:MAG: hypothetical protein LBC10_03630, partial [Deltaproteobacteria bacterium]|nr:hypothetical protein [Deltaproteobacteria bacterium]
MPDTSTQPPIIDLTEIVEKTGSASGPRLTEQEKLSGHVSDLMKEGGSDDDVGLDDLLAQLNDGQEQEDSGADVDPHERLSMPGMDEMDAVFGQFGAPAAGGKPGAEARAQTAPADSELDDLLDLGEPLAKPAAAPADELAAQAGDEPDVLDLGEPIAKPAAAASADGLDDLLADLDAPVVRPTAK